MYYDGLIEDLRELRKQIERTKKRNEILSKYILSMTYKEKDDNVDSLVYFCLNGRFEDEL